jgi:hypothetical protein
LQPRRGARADSNRRNQACEVLAEHLLLTPLNQRKWSQPPVLPRANRAYETQLNAGSAAEKSNLRFGYRNEGNEEIMIPVFVLFVVFCKMISFNLNP